MSIDRPWDLVFVLAPLLWIGFSWRRTTARSRLLVKGLSVAAILVAFSDPTVRIPERKAGVAVLVDASNRASAADMQKASYLVEQMSAHRAGNSMHVASFAEEGLADDNTRALRVHRGSVPVQGNTDLETALISSVASVPQGYIPKIVLVSGGRETEGSTALAINALRRSHIAVDTIPLSRVQDAKFYLAGAFLPAEAYSGEQIPIHLAIYSSQKTSAHVALRANGKSIGASDAELQSGLNRISVHARVENQGPTFIAGTVTAPNLKPLPFQKAVGLRAAKVLYISEDPAGSGNNLLAAFKKASFEISVDGPSTTKDVNDFQLLVLNNVDLNRIPLATKSHWAEYVEKGGGLLLIGGERQPYKEPGQMDALDRVLPAKIAPPKEPRGMCVGLVLDKSASMEGRKIELAKLSAIGVVDHLKPTDTIGVLIFDNSYEWTVPLRRAQDKASIKRLISGITPDGGTQIAPALEEAYRRVLQSDATYKHIVLLTDGISEEGNSIDLSKEAGQHQVTISTVGLGQDVNRSYLQRVASASGGKSYFLDQPQGLEQILLKDVIDYSGSSAVEKSFKPIVQQSAEILDGVSMDNAPPLKGYIRFEAKPTAQTVLSINAQRRDPLYVHWQYGLGHVGVFTSDAKSRWAESWMAWPGFDRFWVNVSHELLSRTDPSEARADYDSATGDLLITYHLTAAKDLHEPPPQIFVLGPQNLKRAVDLATIAAGLYQGSVHIGRLTGDFRIGPLSESKFFPEIGYFRGDESTAQAVNDKLLRRIADLTGGQFNPDPASVFHTNGPPTLKTWALWPALLGLALVMNIVELCMRKRNALAAILRWRR